MKKIIITSMMWSYALFCAQTDEKYMIVSEREISNFPLQYDATHNIRLRYPNVANCENALLFPIKNLTSIALQSDGKKKSFYSLGKRIEIIDPDITNVFVVCAKTIECSPKIIELYIGQDEEGGECYDPADPLPNVYESIPLLRVENAVVKEVYEGNAAFIDEMSE